ncbi:SDR family oxidoreductase [Dyadobacter sp. CY261]|uniref:SDR family oxidoreductase n=1 Tax=Dyadobacter sp. CY261 TaxID=2907203 RepID=UPI001F45D451|nr:SDR family oxidoreductase [Dyadobacter sp. CY261]MCF0069549.1 SDR family oxidoreductase [Dyadobacter sp. CY261]
MSRLAHKTAVVTGGNSGIGLATVHEYINEGAEVIFTGRNAKTNQEVEQQLGQHAHGIVSDTAKREDIQSLRAEVEKHAGKIDILFINAGIAKFSAIDQATEAFYDEMFDINFKGAYFTIQALLPIINEGGSIVLNTSINAHIGMPGASLYAASKAALLTLAKNLSAELLPRKIRVNAISPGPVATPLYTPHKLGISEDEVKQIGQGIAAQVPVGRFGTPEEIAKAAVYFASDESRFLLGTELIIDGGMATL